MITSLAAAPTTDLVDRVERFLADRHHPALRALCITADGGVVTLRGRVRTYYEKQLAASCCRRVAGVIALVDEIRVD